MGEGRPFRDGALRRLTSCRSSTLAVGHPTLARKLNMAQRGALLPLLLSNSLNPSSTSAAPFIVLSDSLLQPGLLLLRQIVSSALDR